MDPSAAASATTAATSAFTELWRIGGIVAVLLGILVALVAAILVIGVIGYRSLGRRLSIVEDSRLKIATDLVAGATQAMHHQAGKTDTLIEVGRETTAAIKAIPCVYANRVTTPKTA